MGTTSEELKKLYAKLGGKDPKVAGFSAPGEILNAINEIPLPTEYELPTVTTEDAGDVLVVNDEGKWDKGEAGSGVIPNPEGEATVELTKLGIDDTVYGIPKEIVIIKANKTSGSLYYFVNEETQKDICDIVLSGKQVILTLYNNGAYCYTFISNTITGSGIRFIGDTIYSESSNIIITMYVNCAYNSSNKYVSITDSRTSGVPIANGSSDNGKILQVVNGVWAKAAMSKETVVYNATHSGNTTLILSDNKTRKNLADDFISGKRVIIKTDRQGEYLFVAQALDKNNLSVVGFEYRSGFGDIYLELWTPIKSFDSQLISNGEYRLYTSFLPKATSLDAGKTVIVNSNGYWAKADPPSPTHAYSTTEQVVGTWIDGKPVYEKTIDCGAISANTWNQTATGVDNIDNIISIGGFVKSDTAIIPFTTNMTSNDVTIHYVREQNKFQYWAIGSNATGVIIFRYTKTTD